MPESTAQPEIAAAVAERSGTVDCVIGLPASGDPATLQAVAVTAREALAALAPGARGVLLHHDDTSPDGTRALPLDEAAADGMTQAPAGPSTLSRGTAERTAGVRAIFDAARRLDARCCALVAADPAALTGEWLGRLVAPVLDGSADFAAPYYDAYRFGGAITSGIAYPFTQALYGRRIRYPLGGDIACSSLFVERSLGSRWPQELARYGTEAWLVCRALTGGIRVCQTYLGARAPAAGDAGDLAGTLSRALGALFIEAERHAAVWQRVRGSQAVTLRGEPRPAASDPVEVDVPRFLEAFRLGQQNLQDVWGVALPPASLLELRRMAARPDAQVRFADELWARIVYDFALAHRVRAINREHLLAAFAPLYLGWLGAFAQELAGADDARIEARLVELCQRFEAEKPYLISRWRWPDRFSP